MKKLMIWPMVFVIVFLTACSVNMMAVMYDNEGRIAGDTDSYNLFEVKQSQKNNHFYASVGKMEGMDTIWDYNAPEDTELSMTYTLNILSSKAKLVLIHPDGETETLAEMTASSKMTENAVCPLSLKKGLNRIKIVAGENTAFEMDIQINAGNFYKLGL